ncbi:hypothetical protein [Nocardia sp. CA-290969]|uniref:hypothetical protein n=1 Tax=Nocardia sp. CA-290969 TaxID=3239986 RepID=UPI003D927DB4
MPRIPAQDIPTDAQINEGARRLGLADENGQCPRSLRSRVAKTIQLAERETAAAEHAERSLDAPLALIVDAHRRLADQLDNTAATAITAALAPVLYRTAHERQRDARTS